MGENLVGTGLRRREDPALITGRAQYTDDFSVPGMAHVAFLRSQYAHARVLDVDTSTAEAHDGVIAVFTGEDIEASDAPGVLETPSTIEGAVTTPRPLATTETARYVGEIVAAVVAEDRYTAHDAVDLIEVEYDRLGAVTDARDAADEDTPTVHEEAPDNVSFDWTFGDDDAVTDAFDEAPHVASVELRNQRLIGDPMEPRSALVEPDGDGLQITASSQMPYRDRPGYAAALGLSEEAVRVISPSVGGGFGIKGGPYPDEVFTAWCAMQLGQPVKWTATRTEVHVADNQSRDWYIDGELALDATGDIRGLRVTAHNTVGAYYVHAPSLTGNFETLISGQYTIPAIHGHMIGTYTTTTPIAPYRGAGRPEVIFFLERLMDEAAREVEMDPTELRRRNQIPSDAFPYETVVGSVYDSGDYERALDVALEAADYEELRERQAALREDGRYLGIGVSCFVENSGSSPGMGETSRVRVHDDGSATAYLGTHDHGQGHWTTFSQLLADELELAYEDIAVREGDTNDLPQGTGTFGSRSAALGGSAVTQAAEAVKERAREVAAEDLEAAPEDLEFTDGAFQVSGAPSRSIHLRDIAAILEDRGEALEATEYYDPPNYGYSFGTHVAAVEVDPASGEIEFERYVAVDDCGSVINPLIVEGQIHGGVAQGIAQALTEEAIYDDTGNLLTGSLQDYALPKAFDVPEIETHETITPSPHNPLGVKGTGESGTIASTPAVVNAVVDALRPLGVDDIDMPLTPERVWQAIHQD